MMNELWPILALLALVVAGFALAMAWLVGQGSRRMLREQQQTLETVQKDMRALCHAAVQVGGRVNRLEQAVKQLQQRQQELGQRQDKLVHPEPEARSFEQATKLAQKGASVEELMDICDLSRGEAELIKMMHRLG